MLKNFSARFARGINHCSAPAAPFCLYTLSRSRIYIPSAPRLAQWPQNGGAVPGPRRLTMEERRPTRGWSWVYGSWTDDGRSVPRGPLALVESECTLQVEPSGGERSSASHNSNTFLLFDRKIFRILFVTKKNVFSKKNK